MESITRDTKIDIGAKVAFLIDLAGVDRDDAAKAFNTTKSTLINVINGTGNSNINLYIYIASILGFRFEELINARLPEIAQTYRDDLLHLHQKANSEAFVFLNEPPTYKFAITRLAQNDFFNEYKVSKPIREELVRVFKYRKELKSISNELKALVNDGLLEAVRQEKRTNHFKYRIGKNCVVDDPNKEYYTPSLIKLAYAVNLTPSLERIVLLSNILNALRDGKPLLGRNLIKHVEPNSSQLSAHYLLPLLQAGLIISDDSTGKTSKTKTYSLTDKGGSVLNL